MADGLVNEAKFLKLKRRFIWVKWPGWLASASKILIRILVLGELCLFQVNFEQKSGKWSKYCKLFKLRCCFCDLGAKYLLCLEPLPHPLSPIDYQDSGGLGGQFTGFVSNYFQILPSHWTSWS